jgi:hypothetical protein
MASTVRLFADDCVIYRKIIKKMKTWKYCREIWRGWGRGWLKMRLK